jgi:hypothetical protein
MKGIIFTEFLEMVEQNFGLQTVDQIIEASELPSEGVYTSVGTYDFNEMVQLLTNLSRKVDTPAADLLHTFGLYLFSRLQVAHPDVVSSYSDPIQLVGSIEDHIHVHVRKLYPDAELPSFTILEKSDNRLTLIYESSRGLYTFCKGLIEAAFSHFNQTVTVNYKLLQESGKQVEFEILRENGQE